MNAEQVEHPIFGGDERGVLARGNGNGSDRQSEINRVAQQRGAGDAKDGPQAARGRIEDITRHGTANLALLAAYQDWKANEGKNTENSGAHKVNSIANFLPKDRY